MQSYGRWVIRLVVIMIDCGLFQSFKLFLHTFSYHCIRIDAAAEGVVFEVVAEPQELQGQAPQQEDRGESAQGPSHPSTELVLLI